MQLIKRITDSDVIGGTPELIDVTSRYGARGILVDDKLNVAMMYMSKRNLYKLPGGGIEKNETREDFLLCLNQALNMMRDSLNHCPDYSTKFMLLRDKTILERAAGLLLKKVFHKLEE